MKVNVKRALAKKKMDEINRQEGDAITFGLALGCEFCRDLRGFGRKRCDDLIRGMYLICAENFEQYREDDEDTFSRESVPFLYTGLRNQVTALDVDAEGIEARCAIDPGYGGWKTGAAAEKRRTRYQLLTDRERMFRSFWYAMMLYLWRTYGWGQDRLNRFYSFVRQNYKVVYQEYLAGTAMKDEWVMKRSAELVKKYEDMGVKF